MTDGQHIATLLQIAEDPAGIAKAQNIAKRAMMDAGLNDWPHNGCAANLSALLELAGINVPMTLGAGRLAHALGGQFDSRGWQHIPVGRHRPGDVGVAFDTAPPVGADHVYLVTALVDEDDVMVSDNQDTHVHTRSILGQAPFTATDYFLRAPA